MDDRTGRFSRLAAVYRRKLRRMASATADAVQSCGDIHECGFKRIEDIVERSLDRVECRLHLLLLRRLGHGRRTRPDVDDICDPHIRSEHRRLTGAQPGITEQVW